MSYSPSGDRPPPSQTSTVQPRSALTNSSGVSALITVLNFDFERKEVGLRIVWWGKRLGGGWWCGGGGGGGVKPGCMWDVS